MLLPLDVGEDQVLCRLRACQSVFVSVCSYETFSCFVCSDEVVVVFFVSFCNQAWHLKVLLPCLRVKLDVLALLRAFSFDFEAGHADDFGLF